MQDYQERIQLDRYAVKDQDAQPQMGDTVIASIPKVSEKDGKDEESRELAVITSISKTDGGADAEYSVALRNKNKPQDEWEVKGGLRRGQLEVLVEKTYADICRRVANGIIKNTPDDIQFRDAIFEIMSAEMFVPAGRILSGVGRDDLTLTLFNCYVFPPPHDSRVGIAKHWQLIFDTFSMGGGIGWHCSSLRPKGAVVRKVNGRSSGSVSWMEQFSQITGAVEQGGSRRGASLQGLWVWHPDIIEFVEVKSKRIEFELEDGSGRKISRNANLLENSNVSVLISDKFMEAVKADAMWDLVFPDIDDPTYDETWKGDLDEWLEAGKKIIVHRRVKAKWLWELIIKKAWEAGEPGIIFMDRANKMSNSYYYNKISCTNPCGEELLPPFGVCNLGHLHLAKFIRVDAEQFPDQEIDSESAIKKVDFDKLREVIFLAVKFLDNITDLNHYHMPENEELQKKERRIGLGVLGYGELLVRLGLRYGSPEAEKFTHFLFRRFSKYSYLASVELAKTRGAFPAFDGEKFLESGFMKIHDEEVREEVRKHGIRTVTVNTIAPTGTVGTMLNTTTGIEPYFMAEWTARSRVGVAEEEAGVMSELKRKFGKGLPSYFATTDTVTPEEHIRIQAAAQRWIDASISKTVNMPNSATLEDAGRVYNLLYDLGCKGGTIYRDLSRDKQVLYRKDKEKTIPVEIVDAYMSPKGGVLRPRIKSGLAVLLSQETPTSWIHGAIRMHPESGEPYDFFLVGAKGEVAADVQAISRLISVILRLPNHAYISQETRLEIIRDQLYRIPGGQQVGFGPSATISMPDGVALLIHQYLGGEFPLASMPLGLKPMKEYIAEIPTEMPAAEALNALLLPPNSEQDPPVDADVVETQSKPHAQDLRANKEAHSSLPLEMCPECKQIGLLRQIGHCPHCVICGLKMC